MSNQFVGELRLVGFNFPPTGWAFAQGQLLPISQNTALFSLLGTFYGGDGKSTFALPNLQGSVAIGQGQGTGLSPRFIGEQAGSPTITLLTSEVPPHNHTVNGGGPQNQTSPANNALANANPLMPYTAAITPLNPMSVQAVSIVGSSFPHNNMMSFLSLNWIIAMQGVFPPRS